MAAKKTSASKGERTRRQLMDAGRAVFRKTGYHNAEIGMICREAGKATGVFYLYFKNKQHLLYNMISEFRAEAPHGWLLHGTDEVSLALDRTEAVRSFWQWYKKYQPDLMALMQAATVDKAFLEEWREVRNRGNAALERAITRLQAQGQCIGLDPSLAASAITGMALFSCYNWLSQKIDFADRPLDEEKAIQTLAHLINGALSSGEGATAGSVRRVKAPPRKKSSSRKSVRATLPGA